MELADRLAIARGERPADVVLTNLQLVNVFTGEIYPTEIAIAGTHIVGVGEGYEARERIDLGGRYVAPGLIDAHVHIESSMCTPPEFARAVLTHGVTTVTDPRDAKRARPGRRAFQRRRGPLSIVARKLRPGDMETAGARSTPTWDSAAAGGWVWPR